MLTVPFGPAGTAGGEPVKRFGTAAEAAESGESGVGPGRTGVGPAAGGARTGEILGGEAAPGSTERSFAALPHGAAGHGAHPLARMRAAVGRLRGRFVLALVLGSLALGSAVGLMAVSGWLISRASEQPPVLYLMVAVTATRAFGIGRAVFRYAERLVSHDAVLRMLADLRVSVYRRLERLAPPACARPGAAICSPGSSPTSTPSRITGSAGCCPSVPPCSSARAPSGSPPGCSRRRAPCWPSDCSPQASACRS